MKACSDTDRIKGQPLPSASTDEQYEIEKIVAHKKRKDGKKVYLVKWQGYTYEECTWEPAKHFKGDTLRAYHKGRREAKADGTDSSSDEEDHETVASCVATQRPKTGKEPLMVSRDKASDPQLCAHSARVDTRNTRDVDLSRPADLAHEDPGNDCTRYTRAITTAPSAREPAQENRTQQRVIAWVGDQFV